MYKYFIALLLYVLNVNEGLNIAVLLFSTMANPVHLKISMRV